MSEGTSPWQDKLSKQERLILTNLEEDKSIDIHNSDKGVLIVVMGVGSYLKETARQLSDTQTYSRLKSNPTKKYKSILTELVDRGFRQGFLNKKEAKSLIPEYPTLPTFYHLPKTHIGLTPLQGRPIILGIGSLWLDGHLQPLVKQLPVFLKDTNHLLHIMQNFYWSDHYSWATWDVTNLYSFIHHGLAITAVSFYLETYTDFTIEFGHLSLRYWNFY